ncbi:MAG: NHL repeat-containing protein [Leptospirales bacterium]|nr:NHL repeat-containing protein [Leptospirales bacterium]
MPRFRIREERARELFVKALSFYHGQQYVAAREFLYKSLDVQPQFHLARRYLGDAYYYSGDWNAALEQWEFLDELSQGAYPLVRQRSELLRFSLNEYRDPGPYSFVRDFRPHSWSGHSFARPADVAIDERNRSYLLSFESANILVVSPGGEIESEIRGPFYDRLKGPVAMQLFDGRLYVADFSADRIRVFDLAGGNAGAFGEHGVGPDALLGPAGIAVAADAIYVSDSGNHRIQKFDHAGKRLLTITTDGVGAPLRMPLGLAASSEGELYVADREDGRVLVYDHEGNYLETLQHEKIPAPVGLSLSGDTLIVCDERNGPIFYNLKDRAWTWPESSRDHDDRPLLYRRAHAARGDALGGMLVADYDANRFVMLTREGLRISNLDMRIQRVESRDFPKMGVFLTVNNRLGSNIRGLERSEFRLFENDRRIPGIRADNTAPYNRRRLTVLAVENSPQFQQNYSAQLPNTLRPLLDPLRVADQMTLVRAGEQVRQVYQGLERLRMLRLLQSGETAESPNLGKALYESTALLSREIGPRSVILLVSGKRIEGAFNQYSLQRIGQYARANGVAIDVISFEGEADEGARLQTIADYSDLARATGGRYYRGFDESALSAIDEILRKRIDQRYILTYRSAMEASLSGRYVDIRVEASFQDSAGLADSGYIIPERPQ